MYENLVIREVSATPVFIPFKTPLVTASGVLTGSPLVLIDVQTDQGITGCAYIFTYSERMLGAVVALNEDVKDLFIGEDADPKAIHRKFRRQFTLLGTQGLLGMLLAGLDMALWDAAGKRKGEPVCALLGHAPRPIPAYASFGAFDPERDRDIIEEFVERGFRGLKVKIGGGDVTEDEACIRGIRDIIGVDMTLMVDFNQALTVDEAIRRAERLKEHNIEWIEEPVAAEDLAGHAFVRKHSAISVQTGENCWFAAGIKNAIDAGASDYMMPDVMKVGGITGWMAAAEHLSDASMPTSSHAFVEASAHTLTATPTAHWLEYLDKARPILQEGYDLIDGCVTARGPGLGMAWDLDAVRTFAYAG